MSSVSIVGGLGKPINHYQSGKQTDQVSQRREQISHAWELFVKVVKVLIEWIRNAQDCIFHSD